jgi:hypothetical protein
MRRTIIMFLVAGGAFVLPFVPAPASAKIVTPDIDVNVMTPGKAYCLATNYPPISTGSVCTPDPVCDLHITCPD